MKTRVYRGGLTVETTLDPRLQAAAEAAVGRVASAGGRASLVALSAGGGGVTAWAEAGSDESSEPDAQIPRPPGSAFMPLIMAAAVESGLSQADLVWDAPATFKLPGRVEPWLPQNFSGRFEGEITLRRALEVGGNIPAVKVLSRIGLDNFMDAARRLGIGSPLERDLTLAVGASPVTLFELTSAYGVLADRGLWTAPFFITRVHDLSGRVIYRTALGRKAALSPETAYIVTDMLTGVVQSGTARKAEALGRPAAGMVGRTAEGRDAWFVGYTPEIAAGAWAGFDEADPLEAQPDWAGGSVRVAGIHDPGRSGAAPSGIRKTFRSGSGPHGPLHRPPSQTRRLRVRAGRFSGRTTAVKGRNQSIRAETNIWE